MTVYKATVLGSAKAGNKEVKLAASTETVFVDPDNPVAATQVNVNDASTLIPEEPVYEGDSA